MCVFQNSVFKSSYFKKPKEKWHHILILSKFTGFNNPVFQELQVAALVLSVGFDVLEALLRVKIARGRHCAQLFL